AIATSLEAAGLDPAGTAAPTSPSSDPSADSSAGPSAAPSTAPSATPSSSGDPGSAKTPVVATVLLSDGANSTGELEPLPAAEQREVTQWFAAAGLLLVIGGAGLAAHWFNRFP